MTTFSADPSYAQALDTADPLASFRDRFVQQDRDLIYLDGNSLGPLPVRTQARIAEVVDQEWGVGLVRSWDRWIRLPAEAGDMVAEHLVGAGRRAGARLRLCHRQPVQAGVRSACRPAGPRRHHHGRRQLPHRPVRARGRRRAARRRAAADPHRPRRGQSASRRVSDALDERTALVCLSHVAYRSGALADMTRLTELIHRAGRPGVVGSVPLGRRGPGRTRRVWCRPGRRLHLQVRERRPRRARLPRTCASRCSRSCGSPSGAGSASATSSRWDRATTLRLASTPS